MSLRRRAAVILMKRQVNKMAGTMRKTPRGAKGKVENPGKLFVRLMKYVFKDYLWQCILVFILILTGVIANVQGTMFTKNLIDDYITPFLLTDSPDFGPLAQAIGRVAVFYAVGVMATYLYNRIMVNVTQGTLRNLRNELFEHMETLPIKYFDTHAHGDIMSVYTNDIDTLRQMISQSIPQIINSGITIISVFISMPADGGYDGHGGSHGFMHEGISRTERKILPGTAGESGKSQWIYRGNDERAESR